MKCLSDDKMTWNMSSYQQLALLTTWLSFQHVHNSVKVKNIRLAAAQTYNKTLMYKWLKQIHKKNLKIILLNLTDYFRQLVVLLKSSFWLWAYLSVTAELILIHKKKLTNWDLFLMQQIFLTAALNLTDISARVYSVNLNYTEKENLIQSFT